MGFYSATDFHPDVSVGYLVRRVHQLTQAGLEPVFAAEGLTNIQWHALISIWFERGGTCAALARDLSYDKGATTRLLDVLEDKGWVVRERRPGDRRVIGLALTPAGEAIALRCRLKVIEAWNGWMSDWEHRDVAETIALLQRLRATLERKTAEQQT